MPTRFYFPLTSEADDSITPSFDGGWNYTSEALRRKMTTTKPTGDTVAVGTQIGPWTATAGQRALDRQYISAPLAAQTISGTVKGYIMVREYANTDNVDRVIIVLKVVSSDGSTVRGTLLAINHYAAATAEFLNNATHRAKAMADGDTVTSVSAESGDRVVLEIGYQNSTAGTTPEASAKWGGSATDLSENETTTTDGSPWFEFSANLTFLSTSGTAALSATAEAFAASGKEVLSGSGALSAPAEQFSSNALERISGTLASTAAAAVVSASGSQSTTSISGTASLIATAEAFAAAGGVRISGTSALVSAVATSLAGGKEMVAGTSAVSAQSDALSGSGTVGSGNFGTADLVATAGTVNATGSVTLPIGSASGGMGYSPQIWPVRTIETGTAALVARPARLAARGVVRIGGAARISDAAMQIAAAGRLRIGGQARMQHAPGWMECRASSRPGVEQDDMEVLALLRARAGEWIQ